MNDMDFLEEHLIKAIQERLKDVAAEELKKCEDNIRLRMADYVSGTVIRLMQHVSIQSIGKEIILRVEMPNKDTL